MTILATDDFNRADATDLGALWDVVTGQDKWRITSNTAHSFNNTLDSAESYNGVTWPDDQYSQMALTATAITPGLSNGPIVRAATAAETFYRLSVVHADTVHDATVAKVEAGSVTVLAQLTQPWTDGDLWQLAVIGSVLVVLRNGAVLGYVTDTTIPSGRPGVGYVPTAPGDAIDSWEGGTPELPYGFRDWSQFPRYAMRKPVGVR